MSGLSDGMRAIFTKKGVVRWSILRYILLFDALLLFAAFGWGWLYERALRGNPVLDQWGGRSLFTTRQWVAVITPGIAFAMAVFAHWRDGKRRGRGIRDIIKTVVGKHPYCLETAVISASITKQSVLVAIAAVLVVIIQDVEGAAGTMSFVNLMKWFSTFGFAFSILFMLVSMLCYDYANRFRWPPFYKAQLVRKALRLDVLSWYVLLFSFFYAIALFSPALSILTCVTAGFLMWLYYFFPRGGLGDILGLRELTGRVVEVQDLEKTKEFYCDRLGLKALGSERPELFLRVGGWAEVVFCKGNSAKKKETLAFMMPEDDLKSALAALEENEMSYGTKETPLSDGLTVQIVSFDDPDEHTVELHALWHTPRT